MRTWISSSNHGQRCLMSSPDRRKHAMGTLVEEILSARVGRTVHAGEIVVVDVDYAMSHDTTTPLALEAFRKLDRPLWDPSRIVIAIDHVVPASTPAVATTHRNMRQF